MKFTTTGSAILIFAFAASQIVVPAVAQEKNLERNAYLGETHLHTSRSLDAWTFGNCITSSE